VILGGLRATFLCDYSHTFILMILILYFYFFTYCETDLIGGLDGMYELLRQAGQQRPVSGNYQGSYLTFKSDYGLVFMVIQIVGAFAICVLDQSYWQRAIASKADTAVRAYLMGGIAWLPVPLTFSTTMGLVAIALTNNPAFPYYPDGMTAAQISAGLAAPAGVVTLLGKGGAAAMLILLFMAVTSAASSELIATSSVLTFDIYQIHINPEASSEALVRISHIMIAVWAVTMASVACLWNGIGLSLNWLFLSIGVVTTGAVGPVIMTILWKKQSRDAAIAGAVGGLCVGMICWMLVARYHFGAINIATTGESYSMLAGNLGSFCSGPIISAVVTWWRPDTEFDWSQTRNINPRGRQLAKNGLSILPEGLEAGSGPAADTGHGKHLSEEKQAAEVDVSSKSEDTEPDVEDYASLERSYRFAIWTAVTMSVIIILVIPLPLFFSEYIFSLRFFKAWVIICVIWLFLAAGITSLLPLWESRAAMSDIVSGILKDIRNYRTSSGA